MTTQTTEKQDGLRALEGAIGRVTTVIKEFGGTLTVKMAPKVRGRRVCVCVSKLKAGKGVCVCVSKYGVYMCVSMVCVCVCVREREREYCKREC